MTFKTAFKGHFFKRSIPIFFNERSKNLGLDYLPDPEAAFYSWNQRLGLIGQCEAS